MRDDVRDAVTWRTQSKGSAPATKKPWMRINISHNKDSLGNVHKVN